MDIDIFVGDEHPHRDQPHVSPAYLRHLLNLQFERIKAMITPEFQAVLDKIEALFTNLPGDTADVAAARAEDLAAVQALLDKLSNENPGGGTTGSLVLDQTTLPDAVVGSPYSQALTFSGATGAVQFASSPASDNGLTVNVDGTLTGTASGPADSSFAISGTDSLGKTGSGTVTVHAA
jgi:hypothetical protein